MQKINLLKLSRRQAHKYRMRTYVKTLYANALYLYVPWMLNQSQQKAQFHPFML